LSERGSSRSKTNKLFKYTPKSMRKKISKRNLKLYPNYKGRKIKHLDKSSSSKLRISLYSENKQITRTGIMTDYSQDYKMMEFLK